MIDKNEILKKLEKIDLEQKELRKLINDEISKAKCPENVMKRVTDFKSACEELNIKTHGDAFKLLNLDRQLMSEVSIKECDDVSLRINDFYLCTKRRLDT